MSHRRTNYEADLATGPILNLVAAKEAQGILYRYTSGTRLRAGSIGPFKARRIALDN